MESAVQTTPPMSIAATIPALPLRPTATRTSEVMMRVMMVMPLTGLEPTIAMALAATVVKRNDITATISRPISACQTLLTTPPKAKKTKMARRAMTMPKMTAFMEMSFCVRSTETDASPGLRLNSPAARPTADLMTPAERMMPMIPAVAMPPMPICLA